MLDEVPEISQDVYRENVYCLLLYSAVPKETKIAIHFGLILRAGEPPGEYQRCGIAIIKEVALTADCERSTFYRSGLSIHGNEDLGQDVRKCDVFEAWFKCVEEQEIILV